MSSAAVVIGALMVNWKTPKRAFYLDTDKPQKSQPGFSFTEKENCILFCLCGACYNVF